MSDHAKIVLWLGFFMIIFGIVKNWHSLSGTIFGSGSASNTLAQQQKLEAAIAKNQHRPLPGSVQSRF